MASSRSSQREGGGLPTPEEKAETVRRMFGAIAPRYDLLNHVLSLNMDRRWRRDAIDALLEGVERPAGIYLDACAGTLDLGHELARRERVGAQVVACDFTPEMLAGGKSKTTGLELYPAAGDTLCLPLRDESVAGATVGFGIRNVADLDAGLKELRRVIRPGGRLVILEFTTPSWQPFRGAYLFYFRHLLPLVGRMVSRHDTAYSYLPASVLEFPEPPALARHMERAGFAKVRWETRTGGIVAIHIGERV